MPNEIQWETYSYNFNGEDDDEDLEDDDEDNDDDDDDDEEDDEYEDKDTRDLRKLISMSKKEKVINTPFGMFQVDDKMNPFKQFEFWMGHTNFDLTKSVISDIESTAGVEVLIPLTRYRFILATGNMFKFPDVRVKIEKVVCNKHYGLEDIQENVHGTDIDSILEIKRHLRSKYKKWSIYVFPNGRVTYASSLEGIAATKRMKELSSGILITSADEE